MALEDTSPGAPAWWRDRLLQRLDDRARDVAVLEQFYDGEHPLPEPPTTMQRYAQARDAFLNLSRLGITNYVAAVADAPAQRLRVTGFRFGEVKNLDADPDAWAIWQRNHLDADSGLVHHNAFVTGQAFALVWVDDDGLAQITPEHPSQAIVAYVPGSRRERAAGLKRWVEDDGSRRVVLYLPDDVYKWRSDNDRQETNLDGSPKMSELKPWQPESDTAWPIFNPLGVVPLVEFAANPSLKPAPFGGGRSEFGGVLVIQNRINKTVFDRLVTGEFQAFRQRWAVGWTPDDPAEAIKMSVSRLMSFDDSEVKLGEFSQADFTGFLQCVADDVKAMAAITSTPFYTLGELANPPSGDALMALQSGLVAKTESHRDNFGESWEEVLRLALAAEGNVRAADTQTMVLWRSVAHVTWAEIADAAVKMKSVGVPDEALWLMFPDVTPQDVERWKVMQADKELFAPAAPVSPVTAFGGTP